MSRLPCPVCSHPMAGHRKVCGSCSGRLLRDLADTPSICRHLVVTITRQDRIGSPVTGRSESGLPWSEKGRQADTDMRQTFTAWVTILQAGFADAYGPLCASWPSCDHRSCERIHLTFPAPERASGAALWLLSHRGRLLGHSDAGDAVDELGAAIRRARRAIDLPPGWWYAGPCGMPTARGECPADLYVRHGAVRVHCRTCSAVHQVADREAWLMAQVADHQGSATEIARALQGLHPGLTASALRGHAGRMKLFPISADHLGRPRYRYGDVLDLLAGRPRPLVGPSCVRCHHLSCRVARGREQRDAA